MSIGLREKPGQLDLFRKDQLQKEEKMKTVPKRYNSPFHSDFKMDQLGIVEARMLEGAEHDIVLARAMAAVGEWERKRETEGKVDDEKFEIGIGLLGQIAYEVAKLRGRKDLLHEEFMQLAREIIKTLDSWKFSESVFKLLKPKGVSAPDVFGDAAKEKQAPKMESGIERSLPQGDRDEENE